ncbi:hypothetical protein SORBI_3006G003951 [Sorghum bicolor]|uniref:Uncharacterized protein n=1 Tax=Sorghum bicolor TaxID=4558 RepID=A0A1Z5RBD0_SORBI|nr:hypothetical protein SORBI_3006G003951 [Sorghum bicolor]
MTSIGDHGVVDIDSSISLETTCYAMACFHGTGAQHWNQLIDEGISRTHSCALVIKSLAGKHGKMFAQLVLGWGL